MSVFFPMTQVRQSIRVIDCKARISLVVYVQVLILQNVKVDHLTNNSCQASIVK